MSYKVVVFDFDGTLVDTNDLKNNAYYKVFGDIENSESAVDQSLANIKEESRYSIIKDIASRLNYNGDLEDLSSAYNEIVEDGAVNASELNCAEKILEELGKSKTIYLSSNTPKVFLDRIIEKRNWSHYFKEIFGYPSKKPDTLEYLLNKENISPNEIVVIGDGKSDEDSAASIRCRFFDPNKTPIADILKELQGA